MTTYNIEPRIEILQPKKLVGKQVKTSLVDDKTVSLWQDFMPRRKEILHVSGIELYSLRIYEADYFTRYQPYTLFEKWAAVEVSVYESIPQEMERFDLQGGLYAVFPYKGLNTDGAIFQYIYTDWLPNSEYILDYSRPHFEVLGEKYKNNHPDSEEDIWIPISKRF